MLTARILAAMAVALPAIIAVALAAVIAHGVSFAAWRWLATIALLWLGTLPFVVLGIAIGALAGATVAYALSTGAWFALAALGGLWVPPGSCPRGCATSRTRCRPTTRRRSAGICSAAAPRRRGTCWCWSPGASDSPRSRWLPVIRTGIAPRPAR